jgi:phosphoglycerate dehydrogenase-like enzyme
MTQRHSQPAQRPLRIMMSADGARRYAPKVREVLAGSVHEIIVADDANHPDAEVAFVSRDVTGLSTKHEILPATQAFYDALSGAPSLQWVHTHSAGADRAIFGILRERGVQVTTSSGANASVVAQTALAGILSLARHFPLLAQAQRERRWLPLIQSGMPRDLEGQAVTIVGWGPIGRTLGTFLAALGMHIIAVRQSAVASPAAHETVSFDAFHTVLPRTDWLVLACPLTDVTRSLMNETALRLLPTSAYLVNIARGEVVDETALCTALETEQLAGAYLDVFEHEPLPSGSPLWNLPNVILTPHSAGFSNGNSERVARMFLENLGRWARNEALRNLVG